MDGVLTDMDARYIEKFGAYPIDEVSKRKHFYKNWKAFVNDHEFETLEKHPGADKLLQTVELLNRGGVSIEILSSSGGGDSHEIVKSQKIKWLLKHEIQYKANIVPGSVRKADYARPWHILVDDTVRVVDRYRSAGGTAILHKDVDKTIKKLHELHLEWKGGN